MLTQAKLKKILHYEPETGAFTWRVARARRVKVGQVAGWLDADGYVRVHTHGRTYGAHALAVLYMTGHMPADEVDHINGVRDDNRWCNLREVSKALNGLNRGTYATNTSGFKGVNWHSKLGKWRARIQKFGKRVALGCYDTKEEAYAAYTKAADEMFGHHKRTSQEGG